QPDAADHRRRGDVVRRLGTAHTGTCGRERAEADAEVAGPRTRPPRSTSHPVRTTQRSRGMAQCGRVAPRHGPCGSAWRQFLAPSARTEVEVPMTTTRNAET